MTYHVISHKNPLYVLLSFCYVITYKVTKILQKMKTNTDMLKNNPEI